MSTTKRKYYGGAEMLNPRYVRRSDPPREGGHGSVQIYTDTLLDRPVAVKTLRSGIDTRRLFDEINALGIMKSKHVVQVYDVEVDRKKDSTEISLIQEFIDGNDLDQFIGDHVSLKTALGLLAQLAIGLRDVHHAGITHRDVKPNNIKVDNEGVLKLFDFGLARVSTSQSTVGIVGTPGFMAPELRNFGTVSFTNAVDVFAYGIVAWCLLSEELEPPDDVDAAIDSFEQQNISPGLISALKKTLSTDPNRRPKMDTLCQLLLRELTFNEHLATVITPTETAKLDVTQPRVSLSSGTLGQCEIVYDGYDFWVEKKSGDVYVNNVAVENKRSLTGSTLITLGSPARGFERVFIPFNVSHPEVKF